MGKGLTGMPQQPLSGGCFLPVRRQNLFSCLQLFPSRQPLSDHLGCADIASGAQAASLGFSLAFGIKTFGAHIGSMCHSSTNMGS